MSKPKTAQSLIEALKSREGEIDNIVVAFSVKGAPNVISLGVTDDSTTTWVLGALEWLRWHVYDDLSQMRQALAVREALEAALLEKAKESGAVN